MGIYPIYRGGNEDLNHPKNPYSYDESFNTSTGSVDSIEKEKENKKRQKKKSSWAYDHHILITCCVILSCAILSVCGWGIYKVNMLSDDKTLKTTESCTCINDYNVSSLPVCNLSNDPSTGIFTACKVRDVSCCISWVWTENSGSSGNTKCVGMDVHSASCHQRIYKKAKYPKDLYMALVCVATIVATAVILFLLCAAIVESRREYWE